MRGKMQRNQRNHVVLYNGQYIGRVRAVASIYTQIQADLDGDPGCYHKVPVPYYAYGTIVLLKGKN